jgi:hypothetical protein
MTMPKVDYTDSAILTVERCELGGFIVTHKDSTGAEQQRAFETAEAAGRYLIQSALDWDAALRAKEDGGAS